MPDSSLLKDLQSQLLALLSEGGTADAIDAENPWVKKLSSNPELIQEALKKSFRPKEPPPPGISHVVRQLVGGVSADTPWYEHAALPYNLPKLKTMLGVGQGAVNALGDIGRLVGDATLAVSPWPNAPQLQPLERAKILGNALTMGMSGALDQRIAEQETAQGLPRLPGEYLEQGASAVGNWIGKDILPGREAKELLSGQRQTGTNSDGTPQYTPLTSEEIGQNLFSGAVKSALPAGLLAKWWGRAGRTPLPKDIPPTVSIGEVEAWKKNAPIERKVAKDSTMPEGAELNPVKEPIFDPETTAEHTFSNQLWDISTARDIVNRTMVTQVYSRLQHENIKEALKGGKAERVSEIAARAIEAGALDNDVMAKLSQTWGVSPDKMVDYTANVLRSAAKYGGEEGEVLSHNSKMFLADKLHQAGLGDQSAIEFFQDYRRQQQRTTGTGDLTNMSKVHNALRTGARFRLGMMVSRINTFMRNTYNQATWAMNNFLEDGVADMVGELTGAKVNKVGDKIGGTWGDALQNLVSLRERMNPADRMTHDALLDALPLTRNRLITGDSYDLTGHVVNNLVNGVKQATEGSTIDLRHPTNSKIVLDLEKIKAGLPDSVSEVVQAIPETLNIPNRIQEHYFRKLAFDIRLMNNARALGYKDRPAIMEALHKAELDPKLAEAVENAEAHALKSTFAYDFKGSIPGQFLDWMRKMEPYGSTLAYPFPRFAVNQFLHMMDRSPAHFTELLNPEFRQALTAGVDGGIKTLEAQRTLAKATDGLIQLAIAYNIRSDPNAGPKWYQIAGEGSDQAPLTKIGEIGARHFFNYQPHNAQGEQKYIDIQTVASPGGIPLGLMDALVRYQRGQALNYSSEDIAQMITGARGLEPIFHLTEIIKGMKSDDPEASRRAWETPSGRLLASFFTSLSQIRDVEATMGSESAAKKRRTTYDELAAPVAQMVPPMGTPGTGWERYYAKRNPLTGRQETQENPGFKTLLGWNIDAMSGAEKWLANHPALNLDQLVGNYGNAAADDKVRQQMGKILSVPVEGQPIIERMVQLVDGMKFKDGSEWPDTLKESMVKRLLDTTKAKAIKAAIASTPPEQVQAVWGEYLMKQKQLSGAPHPIKVDLVEAMRHINRNTPLPPPPRE